MVDDLPIARRRWLSWGELLVVVATMVACAAIALPGYLSSLRASNERHASTTLKTISTAEADFRANDRDENRVNDYWTADVAGLYGVKTPSTGREIRLIELKAAQADPRPWSPIAGGVRTDQAYLFIALERDENDPSEAGYRIDTDKSGRKVHHPAKFGFCAYPPDGGGKFVFIVNENNTIFRFKGAEPRTTWPSDTWVRQQTWPHEGD